MWNIKIEIIPALITENRIISKSSRNYLNNTPENNEIKEQQQQTAIPALPT
jgi:hypothetical protein